MTDQLDRLTAALADRYAIERELGAGGMATVYLAEDLKHHRKVAVKVLRPELAAVLGAERFLNEIQVAAQLNHPHILPLFDSGEADGYLYYVMPVVAGESLRDRMNHEHQLPIDEAASITQQVAGALDYAHRQGVIHRDIKPENVLLHEGEAMVTDFGIALAISEAGGTRLTETGLSLGTPHYMSPEQSAGDRELDARSDVYALGCVLYEMLTGEPPFTGNSVQALIAKRLTEPAPSVMTLRDTVPRAVSESLAKALARSPADRHNSAAAFSAAMVKDETITMKAADGLSLRPHPVRTAALFGLASVVTLGVVYGLMLQLGLPDWVLRAAVGLVVVGLPIILTTALTERRRLARGDRQQHQWLNWRRALQGGGLAFMGLGVATAGFMGMRALGIGPAGTLMTSGVLEARDRILLAEFENRTPDPTLAETITGGLRIDLSQSRVVQLVEPATVRAALERMVIDPVTPLDEALARRVAEREGVKAVLVGEVSSVGSGFMLTARLISPVDGALLGAERVSADDETELISAIDQLSARLRERVGESLRDVRASPALDRVTTTSLEALRKFTQAVRLDELENVPMFAVPLLEEAVVLDTTFAMAYRKLGVVLQVFGRTDASLAAFTRAFELRDGLPERERYNIEAYYYGAVDHDLEKMRSAYRSTLAIDPENYLALNNLSASMRFTRQWAERESLALRAVEVWGGRQSHGNLILAQLLQGRITDAQASLDRYTQADPGDGFVAGSWQVDVLWASREYDRAGEVLRGLVEDPDMLAEPRRILMHKFGDLLRLRGRVTESERWYRDWWAAADSTGFGPVYHLAMLRADGSDPDEALRLLDPFPLDSTPPLERPYLELAEFHAAAGRLSRARRLLAEYEQQVPAGARKHPGRRRAVHLVNGEIALAEGRFSDAIVQFSAAYELGGSCTTCGLARLGYSWLQAGQPDSALITYERLVSMPTDGRRDEADVRWLPDAFRRLGQLYEARNDTTNAVNSYNEFVELWKDADQELQPLVADVRRRIARLVGEPGN